MRLQKRIWSPLFFANFLRETLIWYIFSVLISKFIFRFSQRLFLSSLFFSSRNIWHSKSIVYLSNLQKHPTKYKKIQKYYVKQVGYIKIFYWKKSCVGITYSDMIVFLSNEKNMQITFTHHFPFIFSFYQK